MNLQTMFNSGTIFTGIRNRRRAGAAQRRAESLERRVLLTAGDLDLSFGANGHVLDHIGSGEDAAIDTAIQPDGKILVAGPGLTRTDFVVTRYMPNGERDTSFGANGIASVDVSGTSDRATGVAVRADGTIVVVGTTAIPGYSRTHFAAAWLTANGMLDTAFANGTGKHLIDPGDRSNIQKTDRADVAIDRDGGFVVVGYAGRTATDSDFLVAQFLPDGTLDENFSGDGLGAGGSVGRGVVLVDFPTHSFDIATTVAIQADGKIIVAGQSGIGAGKVALIRLLRSGRRDLSFGFDGYVKHSVEAWVYIKDVQLQADGKIILVGQVHDYEAGQNIYDFLLVRLTTSGSLDAAFDGDVTDGNSSGPGIVSTSISGGPDMLHSVALQANGKILVAGSSDSERHFVTARYNENGSIDDDSDGDGGYFRDGYRVDDFMVAPGGGTAAYGVVIQANGQIVAAGSSTTPAGSNQGNNIAMARYQGDPTTVEFAESNVTINENAGTVSIAVKRSGGGTGPFQVNYTTQQATAIAGSDYRHSQGTLEFANGELTKTITVPVLDDLLKESDETFTVAMTNATNGVTFGGQTQTTITIVSDDTNSVFTVSNLADAGAGSLRQAIVDSNSTIGRDVIQFSIGTGSQVISPLSVLPAITDSVLIDGRTQSGYIGTPLITINGTQAGSSDGLRITAGNSIVRGLQIGGFQQSGLVLADGDNNVVEGCFIGTAQSGTIANGNDFGIRIASASSSNRIGSNGDGTNDAAERNLISGNRADGVLITGVGSDRNRIAGNYIGTNASGSAALANNHGVRIDLGAKENTVGVDSGSGQSKRNIISGNRLSGILLIDPGTDNNVVAGNYIGTNTAGRLAIPNVQHGVIILNQAKNSRIGTNGDGAGDLAERNLLSGNTWDGIYIGDPGSNGTIVAGNDIGVDSSGNVALGNNFGIRIDNGARSSRIGTDASGANDVAERNIISGNRFSGVFLVGAVTRGNYVSGNYIGLNASGTTGIANRNHGISIDGSSENMIGGVGTLTRNVISGSSFVGIRIGGATAKLNRVQGNYVGTNAGGTAAIPNQFSGIGITDGASENLIGGDSLGAGNLVSGNEIVGIGIETPGAIRNVVQGNRVGVAADGVTALGNTPGSQSGWGIIVVNASQNIIGGISPHAANLVAFNAGAGIAVYGNSATGNSIRGNQTHSNVGRGIDLGDDGATLNDAQDADTGPNGLQNFPVLTSVVGSSGNARLKGTLNSRANSEFAIDFFASPQVDSSGFGEGQHFLGTVQVTTNSSRLAAFDLVLPLPFEAGEYITCTATDSDGNSSEFSAAVRTRIIPTDIILSAMTVPENKPAATLIGSLTAVDGNAADTFSYALVSGTGSNDNTSFQVSGNTLRTASSFNFEDRSEYSLRLRVTDSGGLTFEKPFKIHVTNVNEAPTSITLSSLSLPENATAGSTIGTFAVTDVDSSPPFALQLVSGTGSADNSLFTISGASLKSGVIFDFEQKANYSIRVRARDAGGLTMDQVFSIQIVNRLDGTAGVDEFVLFYSSGSVKVTMSVNGAPTVPQGTFPLNQPLTFFSLTSSDRVKVLGTPGDDVIRLGSTLFEVNKQIVVLKGPARRIFAAGAGNDVYRIDADEPLGLISLEEPLGGFDTVDFSDTSAAVALNLSYASAHYVNANLLLELNAGNTFEQIIGGSGNDLLTGNALSNVLKGNGGNDVLNGATGSDSLVGGMGNDTYLFSAATSDPEADVLTEISGEGLDTLSFETLRVPVNLLISSSDVQTVHSSRTLKLNSGVTIENATGGSGNDLLIGNSLTNKLIGNAGHDVLVGNSGNDDLSGGTGRDLLIGGMGSDQLSGGSDDDILVAGRTTSDLLVADLNRLRVEWTSPNQYLTRVSNIRIGFGSPTVSLKPRLTVFTDGGMSDTLFGDTGADWYFKALDDVITDLATTEMFDTL